MATTTGTATTGLPPEASKVGGEITAALANADSTAADRVQNFQLVHQARLSQLSRAAASAKAQYGATSSEAQAADSRVAAATATVARVSMVYQQLTTPDPKVTQNGWVLHGRVYDENSKPVNGFTVFLIDDKDAYQSAYGFAYTDASGYFQLNYAGPEASSQAKSTAGTNTAGTQQLFIQVVNNKAQPVYPKTTPFQPVMAASVYQNVNLPAKEPLGNPPQQIRSIAFPKRAKKGATKGQQK